MIPIYLCDDQPTITENLKNQLRKVLLIEELDFQLQPVFHDPEVLLKTIQQVPQNGIYFMDIDFGAGAMDGLRLGQAIREIDPRGFIIYVTTHEELLPATFRYQVEAFDFIVKEDLSQLLDRLREILLAIRQRLTQDQRSERPQFCIETGGMKQFLPLDEIIYFETTPRKHVLAVVLPGRRIEFSGNLTELEAELPEYFLRTHRSFLVNRQHIRSYDRKVKVLRLTGEESCFVARSKVKALGF